MSDAECYAEGMTNTETPEPVPTADDLTPGVVIRVPGRYHPSHPGRPYCLEIITRVSVSRETGVVTLVGKVLSLNGTTTRKRRLVRSVVVHPERVTIFSKPDIEA